MTHKNYFHGNIVSLLHSYNASKHSFQNLSKNIKVETTCTKKIILHVVLYRYETCHLDTQETEQACSRNGCNTDNLDSKGKKSQMEQTVNLCSLPNTSKMVI